MLSGVQVETLEPIQDISWYGLKKNNLIDHFEGDGRKTDCEVNDYSDVS